MAFLCSLSNLPVVLVAERPQGCKFIKNKTLARVFSCEFCEIFKKTFFYRKPLVAASAGFFQHLLKIWQLYFLRNISQVTAFGKSKNRYLSAFLVRFSPSKRFRHKELKFLNTHIQLRNIYDPIIEFLTK